VPDSPEGTDRKCPDPEELKDRGFIQRCALKGFPVQGTINILEYLWINILKDHMLRLTFDEWAIECGIEYCR